MADIIVNEMIEYNRTTRNVCFEIARWFTQLNIYRDKSALTARKQLWTTRLNFIILFIALFVVTVIHMFLPQTSMHVISSPTLIQFEQLVDQHPSTLSCPCKQVVFPFRTFMSFTVHYHQVCASDLITSPWISNLFSINMSQYLPLDFRASTSSQFQILALLCRTAAASISASIADFESQQLVNIHAVSRTLLQAQVEAIGHRLRTTIVTNVLRTNQFLTLFVGNNQFESALQTNYLVYSQPGSRAYTTYPSHYLNDDYVNMKNRQNYCSCHDSFNCSFPSGFYRQTLRTSNFFMPLPPPYFMVPGLFIGCIPSFSILPSTLECFYDVSCLKILALLGINTTHIRPLNASIVSRFPVRATIQALLNELFIERWQSQTNYTNYFHTCAPLTCSYSHVDQINPMYTISNIVSLLGGLIVSVHFISYIIVFYVIRRVMRICIHRIPIEHNSQATHSMYVAVRQNLINVWNGLRQSILTINIFDKSIVLSDTRQQIWATRIYVFLLAIGFSILLTHLSLMTHVHRVIVRDPSRDQFEYIHAQYSSTLSCPCTRLSVLHSSFLKIQPRFHEICSSDWIRDDAWLHYFVMIPRNPLNITHQFYSQDFRFESGRSFFRLLQILCHFVEKTVNDALTVFNQTQLVSHQPLSKEHFHQCITSLTNQTKQEVSILILYLILLSDLFHMKQSLRLDIAIISICIRTNTYNHRRQSFSYSSGYKCGSQILSSE
jgi:hypothetical protein